MFVERLKLLRKFAKISQLELAKELNVAQSTVGMWETGKREPDFETLCKIAIYFDVTSDFLLGLSDTLKTDFPVHRFNVQFLDDMEESLIKMRDGVDRIKSMFEPADSLE